MSKSHNAPMHTAEHVLNQVMVRTFDQGRCYSSHINSKKSKCDYTFDAPLTEAQARQLEADVNAALCQEMDVSEEMMPTTQAAKLFYLGRLPDPDVDEVRIVRIGDFDACPCIGEHVGNTREIGTFRLTSHSFEDGVLRLRFKLGPVQKKE